MNNEEIDRIKTLINDGYITRRKHPELGLYMLNYTNKCQFDNAWEPMTEMCRGLIVDKDWNVVSRSFNKFWNLGEKMEISDLPDELPKIYHKMDGFYGTLYSENGLPAIAARGTFDSTMALWATIWIRSKGYTMSDFLPGFAYIFEIINPVLCREHGMVVDYGDVSGCFLLAVIETATGLELNHVAEAEEIGLPFAGEFDGTLEDAINEMPTMCGKEQEGYVCKYSNGLRIKLKADEYKRIHRTLKGLTPKRILNVLIESGDEGLEEMLADVPDESYKRVHKIVRKIENERDRLIEEGKMLYRNTGHLRTDVERATVIHRTPSNAVAFAILNGRSNNDVEAVALKGVRKTIKDFGTDEKDGRTTVAKQLGEVVSSSGD